MSPPSVEMIRPTCLPRLIARRLAATVWVLLALDSSVAFSVQSATHRPPPRRSNVHTCLTVRSLLSTGLSRERRPTMFTIIARSSGNSGDKTGSTTCMAMYKLPPSGGGGGNQFGDIVRGAFTIFLVLAFFTSPLGAIVFSLFNSFLVLILVLPLIATVGFRVWQSLNTISGACPNCGAPATVLKTSKDGLPNPSLCFNCGAVLQANYDNTAIENVLGRKNIDDLSTGLGGASSFFDVFSSVAATTSSTATSEGKDKRRREGTVIDVDVEDEEIPFQ